MAEYTSMLGLRKPSDSDFVDQTLDISENMEKIDRQFNPDAPEAHTHDGVNSKRIKHSDLVGLDEGDPHPQYVRKDQLGTTGGAAPLGQDGKIPAEYIPAVTDAMLGNRTVNQAIADNPSNTGLLTQILSWLAKAIKGITGKNNWYDPPSVTLEGVNQHILNRNNPHQVTAAQVGAVAKTGDEMTGNLTIKGTSPAVILSDTGGGLGAQVDVNQKVFRVQSVTGGGTKSVRLSINLETGNAYVNGSSLVWHQGNFDPATKMDKSGGVFTGTVEFNSEVKVKGAVNYGPVASDPTGTIPVGSECYNTKEKRKKFYDGTKWVDPMKYV